jgi:cytoskeletal protein CcmA (bactofilin family)
MSERDGIVIISKDTAIKGSIRNCKRLEISGYVEGDATTASLIVHEGGVFFGQAKAGSAEVSGTLQGDVVVDGLMQIHTTGTVNGNVHYGRLAMDAGANLSAEVRNVPPRVLGDFEISVVRSRSARITTEDITAFDPDNKASELTFQVSNEVHGMVTVTGAAKGRASTFTQADLLSGRVLFQHDGTAADHASFEVVVSDTSGGTSGTPQKVSVTVQPTR